MTTLLGSLMIRLKGVYRSTATSRGQTMAEYPMILATIAVIAGGLLQNAGTIVNGLIKTCVRCFNLSRGTSEKLEMTIDTIPLHKSHLAAIHTKTATISGSELLINSTASLTDTEAIFKMYEMLRCATIL